MTAIRHMKRARPAALAALLASAAFTPALAQRTVEVQVSPMLTGAFFHTDPPVQFAILRQSASPLIVQNGRIDHAFGPGVHAGLKFGGGALEGMFWWVPSELSAGAGLEAYGGSVDSNTLIYGVTLLYYVPGLDRVDPFVGLGLGAQTLMYERELAWQRRTDLMGNAVIGAHIAINERLAVRLEGRDVVPRFASNIEGVDAATRHDLMLSAGVTMRSVLKR